MPAVFELVKKTIGIFFIGRKSLVDGGLVIELRDVPLRSFFIWQIGPREMTSVTLFFPQECLQLTYAKTQIQGF